MASVACQARMASAWGKGMRSKNASARSAAYSNFLGDSLMAASYSPMAFWVICWGLIL